LKLVKSFTQLTWKDTSFVWNEVCVEVFDNLKKQISSISVLHYFDVKRQAILKIDAFDYVKDDILSQYNDENVLHSIVFYSKSMISAECNYHIYDKKLLTIIQCFEHWRFELEDTELSIQMFTDHQTLKIFMKNKQLTQWQANYLNSLLKFNFQIIFQSDKINIKVDALTRMLMIDSSESAKEIDDHFQTILISNWINVLLIEFEIKSEYETNLYQRIRLVNQKNELCNEYQQAMNKDELKLYDMKLKSCQIIDNVLFKKSLLWVSKQMHTKLLQEIHDQSSILHSDIRRMIDLVQRFYYWSDHQATIQQYIRNCHVYQRSKASQDDTNDLLQSLSISQQRWQDIIMNFITELSLLKNYNVICMIICHLFKERHYVFCHWEDDDISIEETVWIMLWNIYRLHDLLSSIVSNKDSQFISIMWQSFCKRLKIKVNLSTVYHSEINDQSKQANQDVERELWIYCNYMQNDWTKWLSIMKFSDNFNTFSTILMTSFYFNKDFHSWMSFNSDTTDYEMIHQRIETRKIDDIVTWMSELLIFDHQQLKKIKQIIEAQMNKHRRDVIYEVDNQVWLVFENIKITRSCKDLKDKQLNLYSITVKVETFYRLQLSRSMKHIHSMFSSKYLQSSSNDSLSEQHFEFFKSMIIEENKEHWEVDDILNFRRYRERLQYKVKWIKIDCDDE